MLLLAEVAESRLIYKLGDKAALDARGGIAAYGVIDIRRRMFHRHLKPTADGFRETIKLVADATPRSRFAGAMAIELSGLFF